MAGRHRSRSLPLPTPAHFRHRRLSRPCAAIRCGEFLWKSSSATRDRPLFSPSRRPTRPAVVAPPIAPVKVAAPGAPDQPPFNLLGVAIGTAEGYAVFINITTHDIVRLRTGEGHEGWILQSVTGHEVMLEKNHRTAVVAFPQPSADKK